MTLHLATSKFLDICSSTEDSPSLKLLGKIAEEFGRIPWENLTKFIKKHHINGQGDTEFSSSESAIITEFPSFDDQCQFTLSQNEFWNCLRLSEEVIEDFVHHGTGGTCFSLTHALAIIASDLGFTVFPAMADMKHGPNIHCALVSIIDGKRYIVDPGYLIVEPLQLEIGKPVSVELPGHSINYVPVKEMDAFDLYTKNVRGEKVFRYRIRPTPVTENEFLGHWLASFEANGMNGLHLNAFSSAGRLSAHNFNLRIDDGMRKKNVKLKTDYVGKVSTEFGIERSIVETAFSGWKKLCYRRC